MNRRGPSLKRMGVIGLLALLGGVLGYQAGGLIPLGTSGWALLGGVALGLVLGTLVHELGHALSGVLGGLHLGLLAVGPVQYQPGRGLRWRPMPVLGFAYLLPPAGASLDSLTRRYRRMVWGGPLLGLLFSAASGIWALGLPGGPLQTLAASVALVGLGLNLVSLWPSQSSGLLTDGRRLLRLRPGSPTARREAALLALTALSRRARPRDWPPELLQEASQDQGTAAFNAVARYYAALAALDRGEPGQATALLQEALHLSQALPPSLRASFLAEQVHLDARQGRVDQARAGLVTLPPSPFLPSVTRERVQAALLIREGQGEAARQALGRARAALDDPLALPGMEAAWLDEWEAQLEAGRDMADQSHWLGHTPEQTTG